MLEKRGMPAALRRCMRGRCPRCGEGRIFDGYLTVVDDCAACGEPLGGYRAADGPAFFTITIVGLLLVPLIGFTFVAFRPSPVVLMLVILGIVTALTLVLLRLVKGAFIGFLWAKHERDPGA